MMMRRRGPGLVGVAVVAGTATAASGRVAQRQQEKSAAQEPQAAAPPPVAEAAPPEYMEELEQLAKLRYQGILSPEEFDAKKKQILGI
jgi:hypothetical protein